MAETKTSILETFGIHPIIDDKNHLKHIISYFGSNVFKDKPKTDPTKMLEFINDVFVEKVFLYEGDIIGYLPTLTPASLQKLSEKEREKKILAYNYQRETLQKFWDLYIELYEDDSIAEPQEKQTNLQGQGTYGAVYKLYKNKEGSLVEINDRFIKYAIIDNTYVIDKYNYEIEQFQWMLEYCSFVITMSIIMYTDCILVEENSKQISCIKNKYQSDFITESKQKEHFFGYYSFMAKIYTPFVRVINEPTQRFMIGYIIEPYKETLSQLNFKIDKTPILQNRQTLDEFIKDLRKHYSEADVIKYFEKYLTTLFRAFNLTYQVLEALEKISHLYRLGITLSHRDITSKNIMYTTVSESENIYKIRLIDFGLLCTNIKFKNSESVVVGYHPMNDKYDLDKCNKTYMDLVLFLTWYLRYEEDFFSHIQFVTNVDIHKKLEDILTMKNTYIKQEFYQKKQQQYKWSAWDFAAVIDKLIENVISKESNTTIKDILKTTMVFDNEGKKLNKMFFNVFSVMNEAKAALDSSSSYILSRYPSAKIGKIEVTDYGKIKTYDISDTKENGGLARFLDTYKKNKQHYSQLITKTS